MATGPGRWVRPARYRCDWSGRCHGTAQEGRGAAGPRPGAPAWEPPLHGARLTGMARRICGDMPARRAGLLTAAVCLTAAACSTRQPLPPAGVDCWAVPQKAWAIRLAATGRVVWQAPVQGWAVRARTSEPEPITPLSPLAIGSVAVVASGDAVTGLRAADGRWLWRWAGPQGVDGMWRWRGLAVAGAGGGADRRPIPAAPAHRAGRGDRRGALDAPGAGTGEPAWHLTLPAPAWAPPVPVAGGLLVQAGQDTASCAMPP